MEAKGLAMKKGFTLVELLITVAVIVTLMGMVFRLAGVGSSATAKNQTIVRMQKLENAISGYYAAYGSYPPVPLHGYQSIRFEVDKHGIQREGQETSAFANDNDTWQRVKAACRAQPVAVRYPYADKASMDTYVQSVVRILQERSQNEKKYPEYAKRAAVFAAGFDVLKGTGRFSSEVKRSTDWTEVQVFQFGLLSFLLPRYLFMMEGNQELYDGSFAQWSGNNRMISYIDDGKPYGYNGDWTNVQRDLGAGASGASDARAYMISNQPTQAVTMRWLPALEGVVSNGKKFYGIDTRCYDNGSSAFLLDPENPNIEIFSPNEGYANQYVLDGMTVKDGWGNDLYYYSPPPYQTYTVWSAGPDGKTFPPWIDLATLDSAEREIAAKWIADDVVHLAH